MGNSVARTVGRYEIVEELGRGGMATVYLARQIDLDRLVALKELSAFRQSDHAFTKRFLRESRLAGSLSHPNIVTVHDYFEHDGIPYIAMEYVERGSLRPHIGHMSLTQVAGVLEGLLAGLGYAERRHIVHRDLKPENVMLNSEGRVKITDFGIAKATGSAQTASLLTGVGMTVGTPNYMAPEQAMGQDVGPWTDLYSLGVMAFEFFVGHVPFSDTEEPMAVLMRQVSDPIPPASSINPELDEGISEWIEHLVVKKPEDRTRSANEAWDEFEEIMIAMVGPRWRRSARLLEPSRRPPHSPAGPATPPPIEAAHPPLMPTGDVPSWPPPEQPPTEPFPPPGAPGRTTLSEARTRRLREGDDAGLPTVMPEAPTRRLEESDPPEEPRRRRGRLLPIALGLFVVLFALAAALGGRGSNPAGSNAKPVALTGPTVTGPELAVQVPRGWSRLRRPPNLGLSLSRPVAAGPSRRSTGPIVELGMVKHNAASNGALLPAAFLRSTGQPAGAAPPRTAVRLPAQHLEAWRYRGLRPVGSARELAVYTVPTSGGVATLACAAPSGFAQLCDAIAGTLQLRSGTAYPIGPSGAYATALNSTVGGLQSSTGPQQANLDSSTTLAEQAAAAQALASAYDGAAAQLGALNLSPADRAANGRLVTALRGAAAAYRKAARAATLRNAGAYRAASAAIPSAKAQVQAALDGLGAAGYKSAGPTPSAGQAPSGGATTTAPRVTPAPGPPLNDVGDSKSDDASDDQSNGANP